MDKIRAYENLQETLLFYGVNTHQPYYISSGNPILKFPESPFRMDFYAFCICISGEIELKIDQNQYKITENSFLISAPTTIVQFVKTSRDFRMKIIFFHKNYLLKNTVNAFSIERLDLFKNSSFTIEKSTQETTLHLLMLIGYLESKTKNKQRFTEDISRTIIMNILLEIANLINNHKKENHIQKQDNQLYYRFIELVQTNILYQKKVNFYADKLCISHKYLISVIKKTSGKTPHQIIDEILLKEIYILLSDSENNISEIAFITGFNSLSAFGRFFKKHTTLCPLDYRKQFIS